LSFKTARISNSRVSSLLVASEKVVYIPTQERRPYLRKKLVAFCLAGRHGQSTPCRSLKTDRKMKLFANRVLVVVV